MTKYPTLLRKCGACGREQADHPGDTTGTCHRCSGPLDAGTPLVDEVFRRMREAERRDRRQCHKCGGTRMATYSDEMGDGYRDRCDRCPPPDRDGAA